MSLKFLGEEGLAELWNLIKSRDTGGGGVGSIAGCLVDTDSFTVTRLTLDNDPLSLVNFIPRTEATPEVNGSGGYSEFDRFPALVTYPVRFPSGDYMVKLPTSYVRAVSASDTSFYLYISDSFFTGSTLAPWSGKYCGRYFADSTYSSKTGASSLVSISMEDLRANLKSNRGDCWYVADISYLAFLQWGIVMEYLNLDGKLAIGLGETSTGNAHGLTDSMNWHTGTVASTLAAGGSVQYRHIERPWGGYYCFLDGLRYLSGLVMMYDPYNTNSSSSTFSYFTSIATGSYYPSSLAVQSGDNQFYFGFPKTYVSSGGSFRDTVTIATSSSNISVTYIGGPASVGSGNLGLFSFNMSFNPSGDVSKELSARLMFDPLRKITT